MSKIVCFHLLNDYSGSPKVLKTILSGLLEKGYEIDLVTSKGGILDQLSHPNLKRKFTSSYRFSPNKLLTSVRYVLTQIYTFFAAFRYLRDDSIFYINTILPIGPAVAGKLMHKKIVYHYHENAKAKGFLYRKLASAMEKLADVIISVSAYQSSFLSRNENVTVVSNALPKEFLSRLRPDPERSFDKKNVLMLCSLKQYKGMRSYIELASKLKNFNFTLVVNDSFENIDRQSSDSTLFPAGIDWRKLSNLKVYPQQKDVSEFYNNASLVLNLTDKNMAVETFGLTSLEALSCGLPVIVPTVGGVTEFVIDGYDGYRIDVQNLDEIETRIDEILNNRDLYMMLSANALQMAQKYKESNAIEAVAEIVERLKAGLRS